MRWFALGRRLGANKIALPSTHAMPGGYRGAERQRKGSWQSGVVNNIGPRYRPRRQSNSVSASNADAPTPTAPTAQDAPAMNSS